MMKPYGTKILVTPWETDTAHMGSMELPDTVKAQLPPRQGTVKAVGNRVRKLNPGDTVVFGLGVGAEFDGMIFLEESDVICRIA